MQEEAKPEYKKKKKHETVGRTKDYHLPPMSYKSLI